MELKFKAPGYIVLKEEASCNKDDDNGKDGSIPIRNRYPRHPVPYFDVNDGYTRDQIDEFMLERSISIAKSRPNDIIIRDPAPQWVNDVLFDKLDELKPILEKDSARCFLRSFQNCGGRGMSWSLTVTSRTLNLMVCFNALRCAKVVLEGKAPELYGMHANPNCINPYGYFPLHEAAERFSCDMIKLLFHHGASANVRTVGNDVIENLLPLHVAIENTCMHKYLEDNLSPSQSHLDYIYKLIHLLCLPEMKIFLDTTRLLAKKTNNLLEELWNYIENGKVIQSSILLLAAQEQIRGDCSSKMNGSSKKDGFDIINKRILWLSFALKWEKGSNEMAEKLLKERRALIDCTGLLVDVISHTGQRLSSYIQAHSEVPCVEVLEHVSSILKEYGFNPTGKIIDTINLWPYDCKISDTETCSKELINPNMEVMESDNLDAAEEEPSDSLRESVPWSAPNRTHTIKYCTAVTYLKEYRYRAVTATEEVGKGWDPTNMRRSFFPFWRSVLRTRCRVRVYPAYARADTRPVLNLEHFRVYRSKSLANGSTPTPNHKLGLVGRISPHTSNQPRRAFGTAAISAFRLLKMLK